MKHQHLKVKGWDISLSKNHCITISIHNISSIHIFIKIQQSLGSHDHFWPFNQLLALAFLNLHRNVKNQYISSVNFWDTFSFRVQWQDWPQPFLTMATQTNLWSTFNFLWICINMEKVRSFYLLILQIQTILESCHQTSHTHFFVWICTRKQKSVDFICSFLRYSQF